MHLHNQNHSSEQGAVGKNMARYAAKENIKNEIREDVIQRKILKIEQVPSLRQNHDEQTALDNEKQLDK